MLAPARQPSPAARRPPAADALRRTLSAALALAAVCVFAADAHASRTAFGPFAPSNPFTARTGAATMHGDSESSDASPFQGPGPGLETVSVTTLAAACPTILEGSDGMPVALCTSIAGRNPIVYLLDPASGAPLTSLSLPAGNLFGGVYTFLDNRDRLVVFDAGGNLLRIAHSEADGVWKLTIDSSVSISGAVGRRCPSLCGGVVGLAPDWQGRVWFATAQGVAGYVDSRTRTVRTIGLGSHEQVANSISTAPDGTAVATDHALYLLAAGRGGRPVILWRYAYDRGPARKPGQLSHGTGATPTFFGPRDGYRYLAITDNAVPAEHLIVIDSEARRLRGGAPGRPATLIPYPRLACRIRVLAPGPSGTENSPVGSGRSVFVASTYGYPYPAYPSGAEPSRPATAPFTGGVTRVDLNRSGRGCHTVWQDGVRSAAVPRLDVHGGLLYTISRADALDATGTSDADTYTSVAIDAGTGMVVGQAPIGAGYQSDTLQLAPTIVPGRVMYQGTITGIDRLAPAPPP